MADYDLSDPKQVETYLRNIETEYSYQCLSEREADGCHRLAEFYSTIKRDDAKGAEIYKQNCDELKYGQSCFSYAAKRVHGKGVDKNPEDGVKYLEKSCEYGFSKGCSNAGISYLAGDRVPRDYEKGIKYLNLACDQGRAEPCSTIGSGYLLGKYGLEKNIKVALNFLEKSCDLGSLTGCIKLSVAYKQGEIVPKNDALALKYRERAEKIDKFKRGDNSVPSISLGKGG